MLYDTQKDDTQKVSSFFMLFIAAKFLIFAFDLD
jgi:hypothetical protein